MTQTMAPPARLTWVGQSQGQVLAAHDVRGLAVMDREAGKLGKVDDIAVDVTGQARFIRVSAGGFLGLGAHHWMVPVDAIEDVAEDAVFLGVTCDQMSDAPASVPMLDDRDGLAGIYAFYGHRPFWEPGYRYPDWTERDRA